MKNANAQVELTVLAAKTVNSKLEHSVLHILETIAVPPLANTQILGQNALTPMEVQMVLDIAGMEFVGLQTVDYMDLDLFVVYTVIIHVKRNASMRALVRR
mmetsp:Transcript_1430/g.1903  ORF Transcript_1430/g.1903 Transcript_1430/m.1903 type:complete len:101 (-) Transcript_1430:186-488(-)